MTARICRLCGRPDSRWYVRRRTGACRDTGMCELRQAINRLPPMLTAEQERERVQAIVARRLAEIRRATIRDDTEGRQEDQ